MSDDTATPRTDALVFKQYVVAETPAKYGVTRRDYTQTVNLCRALERELAIARAQFEKARAALELIMHARRDPTSYVTDMSRAGMREIAGETLAALANAAKVKIDAMDEAAALIEQQARTIAELREELKRESDRTTYTVTLLDPLFGEGNNKPVEALVRGVVKTIAEQAARLAECERDAERYRWLRIRRDNFSRTYTHFRNDKEAAELDATIDAAIDGAKIARTSEKYRGAMEELAKK